MIIGMYVETHNWGKTVAMWQGLGFELDFETDHHSGQLTHPAGGPYVFVQERPASHDLMRYPILGIDDSTSFTPPSAATVDRPFEPQHWDVTEMMLRDPDGALVSLQAPLPKGIVAPPGH